MTHQDFAPHEAWVLFQLNDAPIETAVDGDFNVLAIMDAATGRIHGNAFISVLDVEPSALEARRLLASSESDAGQRPQRLYVDDPCRLVELTGVAKAMGIVVCPERRSTFDPLTQDAREGFAAHVSGVRRQ